VSYSALADRYARAIFELGVENDQLKALTDQMGRIAEVYAGSRELRVVLENPLVDQAQREAVLSDIAGRLELGELATNALRVLALRRRLRALPDIVRRLGTLSDEKAGIVRATVISAVPLSEAHYQALSAELERAMNKHIILERQHDPSLIAGVVTRIGDKTIDGSLKGRLAELESQLMAS
jgi:F-type H+-transporting ATPase subunit delta